MRPLGNRNKPKFMLDTKLCQRIRKGSKKKEKKLRKITKSVLPRYRKKTYYKQQIRLNRTLNQKPICLKKQSRLISSDLHDNFLHITKIHTFPSLASMIYLVLLFQFLNSLSLKDFLFKKKSALSFSKNYITTIWFTSWSIIVINQDSHSHT